MVASCLTLRREEATPEALFAGMAANPEVIRLPYNALRTSDLECLRGREEIRELDIRGSRKLGEKFLALADGLPNLEVLDVRGCCTIGETAFLRLHRFPKLKTLLLGGCGKISRRTLLYGECLQRIENLSLDFTSIDDNCWRLLSEMSSLRYLYLGGFTRLTRIGVQRLCLARPELRVVVEDTAFRQSPVVPLDQCSCSVKALDWRADPRITDASLIKLSTARNRPNLTSLNLGGCSVGVWGMYALRRFSESLEELNLEYTVTGTLAAEHLPRLWKLKVLNLRNTPIVDSDLRYIQGLPHLEELALSGSAVTSEGVERLRAQQPRLSVVFSETAFD